MTNTDFTARCMAGKALEDVAGKQDVIADLDTIRAGAAAGATAVQPAALEDYQHKIDSTNKLDADLVDDTNSTNKFATQSQLEQIELNKTNILFNCTTGVNNVVVTPKLTNKVVSGITYNANSDGTISVTAGTPTANSDIEIPLPAGLSGDFILSGCPDGGTSGNWKTQICLLPDKTNVGEIYEDTSITVTLEANKSYIWRWRKYNGSNVPALTIKPMLAPAGLGAQSYTKGVMSNAELTEVTQQSRMTRTSLTQDTYVLISDLAVTLPAGKTITMTVGGQWGNGYTKEISIITGNTINDSNAIGKAVTATGLKTLSCNAVYRNTDSSDVTINVAVMQSATGNNNIFQSYTIT